MHDSPTRKPVTALLAAIIATVLFGADLVWPTLLTTVITDTLLSSLLGSTWVALSSLSTYILTPHYILFALAIIFSWIGYGTSVRGFTLTSGILYCVAVVMCPTSLLFLLAPLVLSFVGYAHQGRADEAYGSNTFLTVVAAIIVLAALVPVLLFLAILR